MSHKSPMSMVTTPDTKNHSLTRLLPMSCQMQLEPQLSIPILPTSPTSPSSAPPPPPSPSSHSDHSQHNCSHAQHLFDDSVLSSLRLFRAGSVLPSHALPTKQSSNQGIIHNSCQHFDNSIIANTVSVEVNDKCLLTHSEESCTEPLDVLATVSANLCIESMPNLSHFRQSSSHNSSRYVDIPRETCSPIRKTLNGCGNCTVGNSNNNNSGSGSGSGNGSGNGRMRRRLSAPDRFVRSSFASSSSLSLSPSLSPSGIGTKMSLCGRTFKCNQCPSTFSQQFNLNKHVRAVHEQRRPFECDVCHARFQQKSHRTMHYLAVHEKLRQFSCDQCLASFSWRGVLKKHRKSIHGIDD